jgi:hypothetical protein
MPQDESFPFSFRPELDQALKRFRVSAHQKSSIVKAYGDPAVAALLNNFPRFSPQLKLALPCQSFRNDPYSAANFETVVGLQFWLHFTFTLSPRSTRRRMASERVGASG